jgi:hypothetical protein
MRPTWERSLLRDRAEETPTNTRPGVCLGNWDVTAAADEVMREGAARAAAPARLHLNS